VRTNQSLMGQSENKSKFKKVRVLKVQRGFVQSARSLRWQTKDSPKINIFFFFLGRELMERMI
jgi:hypothetical protein